MEEKIKSSFYRNLQLDPAKEFAPKWGTKPAITVGQLIDALWHFESGPKAIEFLGRSKQTFNRNIKKLFPNVTLSGGSDNWKLFLVRASDYKLCSSCDQYLLKSAFGKDSHRTDLLANKCKSCIVSVNKEWYDKNKDYHKEYLAANRQDYVARNAKRRALLKDRIPAWADLEKINLIYSLCPNGYHVDHIIPLQGETVCGLHVENNLQYLTAAENLAKSNKFEDVA